MKIVTLTILPLALAACGSAPSETPSTTSEALTLPTQPFPGFILPGIVGATAFGVPTPIGIATTAGLGVGTALNVENLINTSGVYHNDYGWSVQNTTQICNLAAPGVCISGIPGPGTTNVVLAASTDSNTFTLTERGGLIYSIATGNCVQVATPTNGAALHWATCSAGTPFAGIGFNAKIFDDSGWISFKGARGNYPLVNEPNNLAFITRMDAGFYQVFGSATLFGAGQYVYPVGGTFGFFTTSSPSACPGSSTTTTASMAPTATGIGSACAGPWSYTNSGSGSSIVMGASDNNFTIQYY